MTNEEIHKAVCKSLPAAVVIVVERDTGGIAVDVCVPEPVSLSQLKTLETALTPRDIELSAQLELHGACEGRYVRLRITWDKPVERQAFNPLDTLPKDAMIRHLERFASHLVTR